MCVQPILHIKMFITIDTMAKFNGDVDGHGDGNVMCKHTLKVPCVVSVNA